MLSLAGLEAFKKSQEWREARKTFLLRLSSVRDDLEDPKSTRDSDLINKGRAEELRFASDIVDLLIAEAEEDLAQKKEQEEEENDS